MMRILAAMSIFVDGCSTYAYSKPYASYRDVVRFSNPGGGGQHCFGGLNLPPLIGIGLTELQNSGGVKAPTTTPSKDSSVILKNKTDSESLQLHSVSVYYT